MIVPHLVIHYMNSENLKVKFHQIYAYHKKKFIVLTNAQPTPESQNLSNFQIKHDSRSALAISISNPAKSKHQR